MHICTVCTLGRTARLMKDRWAEQNTLACVKATFKEITELLVSSFLVCTVLWIRIRIRTICMFLDLPDPDPGIIKQKKYEKPWFLLLCDFFFYFFIFKNWCKCTFKKLLIKKLLNLIFVLSPYVVLVRSTVNTITCLHYDSYLCCPYYCINSLTPKRWKIPNDFVKIPVHLLSVRF
jgi:hypothetical protein